MVVAHDSGGPKTDIVVPTLREDPGRGVGFLASDEASYASAFEAALALDGDDLTAVQARARATSERFSDAVFAGHFATLLVGDDAQPGCRHLLTRACSNDR